MLDEVLITFCFRYSGRMRQSTHYGKRSTHDYRHVFCPTPPHPFFYLVLLLLNSFLNLCALLSKAYIYRTLHELLACVTNVSKRFTFVKLFLKSPFAFIEVISRIFREKYMLGFILLRNLIISPFH